MPRSLESKYNFPKSIKVNVSKSSYGYTAVVESLPGCVTHAKNFPELIESVNDAILTYFEVPRKEAELINFMYVPRQLVARSKAKSRSVSPSKSLSAFKERISDFVQVTPESSFIAYA